MYKQSLPHHLAKTIATLTVLIATLYGCTWQPTHELDESTNTTALVVRVIDGDTIDVLTSDGGEHRVRVIGIDTPEINRSGGPDECWAQEASDALHQIAYRETVELTPDPTQTNFDKYDRLLRHVWVDGQSVAVILLAAGAGYEYTYDVAYTGIKSHLAAERDARNAKLGLWGAC